MRTEKEIIQKIQYLRIIEPNPRWVDMLHGKLMADAEKSGKSRKGIVFGGGFRLFKPFPVWAAGTLSIAMIVLFGIVKMENVPLPGSGSASSFSSQDGVREFAHRKEERGDVERKTFLGRTEQSARGEEQVALLSRAKESAGQSGDARSVVIGDEKNTEFEEELFDRVAEKLRNVEKMVSDISNASDTRRAKDLLSQAKIALDEGNVVDAFEALVALERLLE